MVSGAVAIVLPAGVGVSSFQECLAAAEFVAPVVGVGQVELADPCMLLVIGEPSWKTRFGSTFLLLVVLLPFLVLY